MKMQAAMVLCMALVASGCASTSKVMLGAARPAIAPEQVQVYYTPPAGGYDEIAVLETSSGGFTYGEQNKMNAVIGKLRTAAAELGAKLARKRADLVVIHAAARPAPGTAELARLYSVSRRSPRVYLYYPRRWKDLVLERLPSAWRLFQDKTHLFQSARRTTSNSALARGVIAASS